MGQSFGQHGSSKIRALVAPGYECRPRIVGRITLGDLPLGVVEPVRAQGVVVPALGPRDGAGAVLGPFRKGERRVTCRVRTRPEDDEVAVGQLQPVERGDVRRDDLAQVEAELLEGGVAAGLLLKPVQADVPAGLAAAVLAGDLVETPFQRAPQAEVVGRDADHLVRLDGAQDPVRQDQLAVVEAESVVGRPDEPALVDQPEYAGFDLAAGADVRRERGASKPLKRVFEALVPEVVRGSVRHDEQFAGTEPDALPDPLAPVLPVHELADAEDQDVLVEDRREAPTGRDDLQPVPAAPIDQVPHVRLGGEGEQRMLHRRQIVLRHDVRDIEDEEILLRVAVGEQCHAGTLARVRTIRNP